MAKTLVSSAQETIGTDQSEETHGARPEPEHDEIAHRAYDLYCSWGFQDGNDLAHWFEAERQLKEEKTKEPGDNLADAAAAG